MIAIVVLCCPSCGRGAVGSGYQPLLEALAEAGHLRNTRVGYVETCICSSCLLAAAEGDCSPAQDGATWQDRLLDSLRLEVDEPLRMAPTRMSNKGG